MSGDIGQDLFGMPVADFGVIYADPPWRFENFSEKGEEKNPVAHYRCEGIDDLKRMPVAGLAADDCALFMWATFPMLPEALDLIGAWGFAYKSGAAWGKESKTGEKWAFGTGYIFRSAAELLLVGTRGAPRVKSRSERNIIYAPVREHSRKPDQCYGMIERLYDGPYLELFARNRRPGWAAWGNEVGKYGVSV